MYSESDLIPLSALQHLLFCERQCALIHLERVWVENRYTAEGQMLHRKAHRGKSETRDGVRITQGLPVRSFALGLSGQCDVVTWHPPPFGATSASLAKRLRDAARTRFEGWTITPIEYKRGQPKRNDCDRVQLCAQAICLEEMLGVAISCGDLFYGKKRRHFRIEFDGALRGKTVEAARQLHELFLSGRTPPAVKDERCDSCSLLPLCLPDCYQRRSARAFVDRQLAAAISEQVADCPSSSDAG